ncbi:MAG TPA: response regulator, partial [Actinomycetota bacterium]|nr:response regulator [Actinomycetota bacterium]
MSTRPSNRYAVVADARSLMRDLLRFLLEQEGFSVASEASTASAAVEAVAEHHPDVVILHEATAQDAPDAIERIREEAPDATLVILTADRSRTPVSLTSAADAVVEEGAGLQDLASVLAAGTSGTVRSWTPRPEPKTDAHRPRGQRWADRLQGAVAASILMLTVVFATSVQPTPNVGSLQDAYDSLEVLAAELPEASVEQAVALATTLIGDRAMLKAASVDVSALDVEIAQTIAPILGQVSPQVSSALRDLLGDLLNLPTPTPSPTTPEDSSPGPTGPTGSTGPTETEPDPSEGPPPAPATQTESPPPAPSETPSTSPSGTPSTSPSVTPSTSPSETPSTSPSETPSTSPSETPS